NCANDVAFHIVRPKYAVPPFRWVSNLLPTDDERCTFLNERLQRFRYEVFQVSLAPAVVVDCQHILAQAFEYNLIDLNVPLWFTDLCNLGLRREFGFYRFDFRFGMQREPGCEVFGNSHSRDGANVEQTFFEKNLAHFIVRLRPMKPKAVADLAPFGSC